jgi:hypothetical protein
MAAMVITVDTLLEHYTKAMSSQHGARAVIAHARWTLRSSSAHPPPVRCHHEAATLSTHAAEIPSEAHGAGIAVCAAQALRQATSRVRLTSPILTAIVFGVFK